MKRSPLKKHSTTEYAIALRSAVIWHRKVVRLVWRAKCAFSGPRCGFYGDRGLEVHHPVPQSRSVRLKYEVTNGILLCPAHHDKAEADHDLFIQALESKWPAMYACYLENIESLNKHSLPLSAVEIKEAVFELKELCKKLQRTE